MQRLDDEARELRLALVRNDPGCGQVGALRLQAREPCDARQDDGIRQRGLDLVHEHVFLPGIYSGVV
jgi:hypothetical protein